MKADCLSVPLASKRHRGRGVVCGAGLGLAMVLLTACGRGNIGLSATPPTPAARTSAPAGALAPAPEFAFTTFDDQRVSSSDLAGRAIVLNFWASWCTPCRAEMPYFERTYRAYQERGVVFVGLAIQDDPAESRVFLKELGITYPAGPDEGNEIALRYQVSGLPATVFITPDGKIARKWTGALSEQQLVAFVDEIAR